ncbi:MAG TPA: tetratricopeptide repeat protein [Bacteroidia bacterium]|nr:tetratricopeptide repeat protein [Bacteroidia bacterium]
MTIKKYLFALAAIALFLSACSGTKPETASSSLKSKSKTLQSESNPEVMFLYVNATKEKILGNLDNSAGIFAEVIRKDGGNHAAMYELADIYVMQKKFSDALFFARSAASANPKNKWYKELLAEIYEKLRQHNEAANVYSQLVKDYPERGDYYLDWANSLLQANKPDEALKVYDKIDERFGASKDIGLQKQRIYMDMGKPEKAVAEVQKLIDANPRDSQLYGILAEIYQSQKQYDKAMEAYEKLKAIDPDNPYLHLSLADYYRNKGDNEKSFQELKIAFSNHDLELNTKLQILSSYLTLFGINPELQKQALELNEILVAQYPDEAKVYEFNGRFLYLDKKPEEARVSFRMATQLDASGFENWRLLMGLDEEMRDWDALIKDSEEAMVKFPNQPIPYLFNGEAKSFKKKYSEAVVSLKAGLKLVVDDKKTETGLYSLLGDAYHGLGEHINSDESYNNALEIDSNNVTVLNNYAYYLSLRGENLAKADSMSKLSNTIVPDNASYEDTYAWILYKQKKYEDAKLWLEKAMLHGGDKNATILEHMGDVLFQLGRVGEALDFWQKAKAAGDDISSFLDKKIADKKLYE